MKDIALFGSTGSIGKNTLEVIRTHPDSFRARYLSAFRNHRLLEEQVREFRPAAVAVVDAEAYRRTRETVGGITEVLFGLDGLLEIARRDDYDTLVSSLVGFAGMLPTIAAIENNRAIALANKETLVVAGELITRLLERHKVDLAPVDSEHSAILQCIRGESASSVSGIILTASGGPFRDWTAEELRDVKLEQALRHPTWNMGSKITIDSATLMNKGLEVIEAHWLFGVPGSDISVMVHRQSIVHSFVEFCDGSVKAQLGVPDMKLPIQYALAYPERIPASYGKLTLDQMRTLTFEEPNTTVFRCLPLAYDALRMGGTAPACLNAANEVAVEAFLQERIGFTDIPSVIEECLAASDVRSADDVETVIESDRQTRVRAARAISALKNESITVS